MSSEIDKLKKLLGFAKVSMAESDHDDLLKELRGIKDALVNVVLAIQTVQLKSMLGGNMAKVSDFVNESNKSDLSLSDGLNSLETIATTQKDANGKRTFLLHRPSADFEFQKSEHGNEYVTEKETEWFALYMPAENKMKDQNPVVSCFIPEEAIIKIPNNVANTGTWNEMGKNPHETKFTVIVKPGKYQIHMELRQDY